MAQRETWLQTDLMKPAQVQVLRGVMFSQDNQGDLVGINVYDNGQPAQLSGTVLGYIVKDNGDTVTITGTLQENRAWIVLPANAYDVVGMIHIAIQLKANSTQTSPILTLGMCAVYVQRTQTGNIVTPEYRILDVAAILEMIDDVDAATAAANAAAGNANTKAGLADTAATRADAAAAALENMDASASTLTSGSDATAQITTVSGHYRALFGIPKGDTGATGPAPQITSTVTTYQESSSGSTVPSGTWQNAIPNPLTQGMFLWTKTVITYDTGDTLTQYSISRQGLDGSGSVSSVNNFSPDSNGNVTLPTDSAPTQSSGNYVTSGGVWTQLDALSQRIGNVEQPAAVFADVSFSIAANAWTLSNGVYTYTYPSALITATSGIDVFFDTSFRTALTGDIYVEKTTGGALFTTTGQPAGTLTGTIRIIDSVNGVVPIVRGGTGRTDGVGGVLVVDMGTISSLPTTKSVTGVTADMIVESAEFGTPGVFSGLTYTTAAGSITISGTIASGGSSTVKLHLLVGHDVSGT